MMPERGITDIIFIMWTMLDIMKKKKENCTQNVFVELEKLVFQKVIWWALRKGVSDREVTTPMNIDIYIYIYILKLGWYLQLEECSMIRQSERIQIYLQSSQTPLTDCFTLTGSSEGNLNNIQHCKNYYIVNVPQKCV